LRETILPQDREKRIMTVGMKKAYYFAPLALGRFLIGELQFIAVSSPDEHDKLINTGKQVVALKSNRSGEWYVLPLYRLILSHHMLERIARKQSFWKYWVGRKS